MGFLFFRTKTDAIIFHHHVNYAATLNDLGMLYQRMESYDEAISYLLEAREISEKASTESEGFAAILPISRTHRASSAGYVSTFTC